MLNMNQMTEVSLEAIYADLQDLKKEVTLLRHALIPEEKVSKKELAEIERIKGEMKRGDREKIKIER